VVMESSIVGDKGIGGVVDSVSIDREKSTLKSAGFATCLTESMMSVSFGAPPEDTHKTTIRNAMVFSPGAGAH